MVELKFELIQLKSSFHALNYVHDCFGIQGSFECSQMILEYFSHFHVKICHSWVFRHRLVNKGSLGMSFRFKLILKYEENYVIFVSKFFLNSFHSRFRCLEWQCDKLQNYSTGRSFWIFEDPVSNVGESMLHIFNKKFSKQQLDIWEFNSVLTLST